MKFLKVKIKLLLCICVLLHTACIDSKKATYFNNMKDSDFQRDLETLEPVIQKNDLLSISVSSLNKDASIIFNTTNLSVTQNANATSTLSPAAGYLVDQEGNIQFPLLGNIQAAGISKKELSDKITRQLVKESLLYDPIVNIRYLNFKVSVLGEVNRPSIFTIPNEKITLLEALGLAGDLTIYAKRDNILLIREENGIQQVRRLDLTTSDFFKSPYYFLKSNDIVYVEPNKAKIASSGRATQWFPVVFSLVTLGIVAIDRLTR
jgi:polysaccharide biosynthesis/export protein